MLKKSFLTSCISCALLLSSSHVFAQENVSKPIGLTDEEVQILDSKKDALLFLLMEKGELKPLMQELKRKERFEKAEDEIESSFPYTEEQIVRRRAKNLDYEKAQNSPVISLKVNISEKDYDPDGRTPIELKVAANNPSSIAFFDYQGNPWPIVGDVIGNQDAYQSYPFSETKNTAVFQIKKRFTETVALINLQGIDQLVVVKLIGDESEFDARKNIRIPRKGPLTEDTVVSNGSVIDASDPILIKLLNGEKVSDGIYYEANWDDDSIFLKLGNYMYVRTKDVVTYPPHIVGQKSANGYNLYKIDFSHTLTMRKDGKYTVITINKKKVKE